MELHVMHIMALSMEIASASSRPVCTKNAASQAFEAYGEGIRDVEKKALQKFD